MALFYECMQKCGSKTCLTPPTLLEIAIFRQPRRDGVTRLAFSDSSLFPHNC